VLTPIINFLAARGMMVRDLSEYRTHPTLHITTSDNNQFELIVHPNHATVSTLGRVFITNGFLRDVQALDIAKERAYRLSLKG
jgi:hypothetical protein